MPKRRPKIGTDGLSDHALARLAKRIAALGEEHRRLADEVRAADDAIAPAERAALEARQALEAAEAQRGPAWNTLWVARPRRGREEHPTHDTEPETDLRRLDDSIRELQRQEWKAHYEWSQARHRAALAHTQLRVFEEEFTPAIVYLDAKKDAVLARRNRHQEEAAVPTPGPADGLGHSPQGVEASTGSSPPHRLTPSERSAIREKIERESWLDLPEFHGDARGRGRECAHCGDPILRDRRRFCSRRCHALHVEAFGSLLARDRSEETFESHIHIIA